MALIRRTRSRHGAENTACRQAWGIASHMACTLLIEKVLGALIEEKMGCLREHRAW